MLNMAKNLLLKKHWKNKIMMDTNHRVTIKSDNNI